MYDYKELISLSTHPLLSLLHAQQHLVYALNIETPATISVPHPASAHVLMNQIERSLFVTNSPLHSFNTNTDFRQLGGLLQDPLDAVIDAYEHVVHFNDGATAEPLALFCSHATWLTLCSQADVSDFQFSKTDDHACFQPSTENYVNPILFIPSRNLPDYCMYLVTPSSIKLFYATASFFSIEQDSVSFSGQLTYADDIRNIRIRLH